MSPTRTRTRRPSSAEARPRGTAARAGADRRTKPRAPGARPLAERAAAIFKEFEKPPNETRHAVRLADTAAGSWDAIVWVAPIEGAPAVTRLEVGFVAASEGTVPAAGLTVRMLRSVPLEDVLKDVRGSHDVLERSLPGLVESLGYARPTRKVPGRKGYPDTFYLAFAVAYVDLLRDGYRHPIQELATRSGRKPAAVEEIIRKARHKYGFLPPVPKAGRTGEPALTPKALELLAGPQPKPKRSRSSTRKGKR